MGLSSVVDRAALPRGTLTIDRTTFAYESVRRELVRVLPIALVLVTAGFLRVWDLNAVGFNTDEAVYAGQAASIANDPSLRDFFPIFRAHPLLFQMIVSLAFQFGVSDLVGRLMSAIVGVATVWVAYLLGQLLYGRRAGLISGLFLAVMPYHVIVTRQVLLDGPATFFTTLALYLIARYAVTERATWLYAAGAVCGLAFLSKETSIVVTLGGIYAFFALASSVHLRLKDLVVTVLCMCLVITPYPVTLALSGRTETGRQYLIWQLFRRPNHDWLFYPTTLPSIIGPLVIVAAMLGLLLLRQQRTWREVLLLTWIAVPLAFFQLWPVKGFQYPLPVAPALAILAARAVDRFLSVPGLRIHHWHVSKPWPGIAATAVITASLAWPAWQLIHPSTGTSFLAGTGGVPGGREVGTWIEVNVPKGAEILAIGPSMANIIQYYGHRKVYGLSVSPNPLHRNPSYDALSNPDAAIRNNEIQYLVWDSYSASRSPFFEDGLLRFAKKYNGRIVHTESVTVQDASGHDVSVPVIVVFEVRP